jgi:hypothetical protein
MKLDPYLTLYRKNWFKIYQRPKSKTSDNKTLRRKQGRAP